MALAQLVFSYSAEISSLSKMLSSFLAVLEGPLISKGLCDVRVFTSLTALSQSFDGAFSSSLGLLPWELVTSICRKICPPAAALQAISCLWKHIFISIFAGHNASYLDEKCCLIRRPFIEKQVPCTRTYRSISIPFEKVKRKENCPIIMGDPSLHFVL